MRSAALTLAVLVAGGALFEEAKADPIVLSGFDAETNGGKSGGGNNNGWQFLQDMFRFLGTGFGVPQTRLVVLVDSLPGEATAPAHSDTANSLESAILNAFIYAGTSADGDPFQLNGVPSLGQESGWVLTFVSDASGLLAGNLVDARTTALADLGGGNFEFADYSSGEKISLADAGILYVPANNSQNPSGFASSLDQLLLNSFLATGGALFVGPGNYGDWLNRIGLGLPNVLDNGASSDVEIPDFNPSGLIASNTILAARGGFSFSQVENTVDTNLDVDMPYKSYFENYGGGFTAFGTSGQNDFVIFRNSTNSSTAPVPEPGSIALVSLATAAILRRRAAARAKKQ